MVESGAKHQALPGAVDGAATRGQGRAAGKVILLGEHFAVHGGAAIAMPVLTRSLTIEVASGHRRVRVPNLGSVSGDALERAIRAMLSELADVRELLAFAPDAVDVTLSGDLPIAAGLGGSASLAAALVRALGAPAGEVQALVHRLEHLAHGRPSGVDGAVVSLETPVWFEDGEVLPLACDPAWLATHPWWIGIVPREGSTRTAVARVGEHKDADPEGFFAALTASNDDVRRLGWLLEAPPEDATLQVIGGIFDEAHARLAAFGVSNSALERLVGAARDAGAYGAKLTGAGLGGAVIATAPAGLDLAPALYSAGAIDVIAPRSMRLTESPDATRDV